MNNTALLLTMSPVLFEDKNEPRNKKEANDNSEVKISLPCGNSETSKRQRYHA